MRQTYAISTILAYLTTWIPQMRGTIGGNVIQLHRLTNTYAIKRDLHTNERVRRLGNGSFEVVPLNLGMG